MEKISKEDIICDLNRLGICVGDIINVKASIRSIGEIDGGADTLIDALIDVVGSSGTIITDSFVSVYSPLTRAFWKNTTDNNTKSYAGALANAMLARNNVRRSNHPVQKFALIGALADQLADQHTSESYAYDILRIISELGGKNLKIGSDEKVVGVGTTHVAIGLAKIKQKIPYIGVQFVNKEGNKKMFFINWSGGCMDAFNNLNMIYSNTPGAIIAVGKIGNAAAKLTMMSITLKTELNLIKKDEKAFLTCKNKECLICRFSWEKHQESLLPYVQEQLLKRGFKNIMKAILIKYLYRYPF